MRRMLLVSFSAVLLATALAAPADAQTDFAGQAYNILPPGESGEFPPGPNSTDQMRMYDALTPLRGNVTMSDIRRYFKPNIFGTAGQGRRAPSPRRAAAASRSCETGSASRTLRRLHATT